MSKWIDADALIMALRLEYPMIPMFKENRKEWEIKTEGYRKAEEVIKDAPSIDIVRCKECKHYAEHNELYINEPTTCVKHSVIGHYVVVNADDYCSYGERREP